MIEAGLVCTQAPVLVQVFASSVVLVLAMVIGNDPVVAVVVVVTVSVDMPPPLTDAGLNEPDAPEPKPAALKATDPVNPFNAVTVTL